MIINRLTSLAYQFKYLLSKSAVLDLDNLIEQAWNDPDALQILIDYLYETEPDHIADNNIYTSTVIAWLYMLSAYKNGTKRLWATVQKLKPGDVLLSRNGLNIKQIKSVGPADHHMCLIEYTDGIQENRAATMPTRIIRP